MRRLTYILALGMLLSTVIGNTNPVIAQSQTVFRVGWGGTSFDTFNPFTTYATISVWLTLDVYSRLVRPTQNYTGFVPDLAESWEVLGNNTIRFHLVKNATFTDGYPVTAEDVAYSYYLANQSWSSLNPYVAMVKDIKVVDNYTIDFVVTSPTLFMLEAAINIPIVPKHIWANVSDPSTYPDNPPVGSGPLKIVEFKEGQYAVLEPNPAFYYPSWLPKVDRIIVKFYSDTTSATNALLAGDIDAVGPYIASTLIQTVENNPNLYLFKSPPTMYFYLAFNVDPNGTGNPALRDLVVRQALAHAINVSYVCGIAWPGAGFPMGTVLPSSNIFADPDLKPYDFNLTLAAKMLDDAGYKVGPDGVRVSPSGVKLEINILVPSNMPEAIKAGQVISQWWNQIGVKTNVQPMDTGSMSAIIWKKVNNTIVLGQDADIWDWFVAPNDVLFLNVFLSNMKLTGVSDSGYSNPEYDKTFEMIYQAPTMDEIKSIAYKLQEMLHRDLPYIPLCEVWAVQAHSKAFTGFDYSWPSGPFGGSDWRTFLNVQPVQSAQSPTVSTTSPVTSLIDYKIIAIVVVIVAIALGAGYYFMSWKKGKR
ncbi:ABC transporter substrate-binding protein [Thermogladius sp. 4427co]|uniref:ABC transporter substrate-binding protein n=1 Tax=Thermogladius sp. 4427co TaxID=3450718 RepID=UPI003F78DB40